MSQKPPFKVFAGTNSRYLAEKICNALNCEMGNMKIQHFADGEFGVSFEESIRGSQVYLVQSTFPNSDAERSQIDDPAHHLRHSVGGIGKELLGGVRADVLHGKAEHAGP